MTAPSRASWVELGYTLGWSFTPLSGKRPTQRGWQRAPREELDTALAWAEAGNVGLRTGAASGIVVIDIDPGADLSALAGELPATVEVRTGRGGRHLYYSHNGPCRNSVCRLAPHVDVRGDGGQVVYPGSVHPESGAVYEFAAPPDTTMLAPLPAWILDALARPKRPAAPTPPPPPPPTRPDAGNRYAERAVQFEISAVRRAAEGERNDTLNRAAYSLGQLVAGGALDRGLVESELLAAAAAVGLSEPEARATIESGLRAGAESPRIPPERTQKPAVASGSFHAAIGPPLPTVLIPGPHTDADGVYIEQTSPVFAAAVLAHLPDDTLYRKSRIVGQIIGKAGDRHFEEISHDPARLIIDRHVRLAAWYPAKRKRDPGDPDHVLAYKPAGRDHAGLVIAAARESERVRDLSLMVPYPAYGPGFERLRPGWQSDGLYYDEPPELRDIEPETNIETIRDTLDDLIVDFPFRSEADRQNFFGLLLTPLVAPAIQGNRPMHLLLSPIERTGKTKLAEDVFGGVILGRPTPALQISGNDEERDKRVLALLLIGETLIHLDNLPPSVTSATLASLLTATTYQGRLLGASKIVNIANALTVVGSGNNTEFSGEIAKRAVPILLEPRTARPELRTEFVHADLRAHVQQNRRQILSALLGMVEIWRAAGQRAGRTRMGGFETWSGCVGGIMEACGFSLWRSNALDWQRAADPDSQEIDAFVAAWHAEHDTVPCTAGELVRVAESANVFEDKFERKTPRGRATAMGKILRHLANRPVGAWVVRRVEMRNGQEYYLEAGKR